MKIELNVENADFTSEVKDLLKSLSKEEKINMANELFRKTLADTDSRLIRSIAAEKAFVEFSEKFKDSNEEFKLENGVLKQKSKYYSSYFTADLHFKKHFDDLVEKYYDLGGYFRDMIMKEMFEHANTLVVDAVKNHEKIKEVIEKSIEEIKNKIPEMVQNAMQKMFLNMLQSTVENANRSFDSNEIIATQLNQITDTLSRNNIF